MKTNIHIWSYLAQFFLEWEKFRRKVVEKKTHFMFNIFFFVNRAVYEIMWKNSVETCRPQTTIWRMRVACWIPKVTNTHSEYIILTAFPLQQWLYARSSVLRNTHIAYLVPPAKYPHNHSALTCNNVLLITGCVSSSVASCEAGETRYTQRGLELSLALFYISFRNTNVTEGVNPQTFPPNLLGTPWSLYCARSNKY
jgi:hypothetical protein